MAKGRLVLDVWKDHRADPFFWVMLDGVKEPYKVYYGREGWIVELHRTETRAKYSTDNDVIDTAKVISTIEIAGPLDEIIKLIEFAGYHGSYSPLTPRFLLVPKRALEEMSGHLATLPLFQKLAENDRLNEYHLRSCSSPLERPTRYDKGAYRGEWDVIIGRHVILDIGTDQALVMLKK